MTKPKHELVDDTLVLAPNGGGIVAHCTCGWVSPECFTTLFASSVFLDHQEEERRKDGEP